MSIAGKFIEKLVLLRGGGKNSLRSAVLTVTEAIFEYAIVIQEWLFITLKIILLNNRMKGVLHG